MLKKMKIRKLLISSFLITTLLAGMGGILGLVVMNNVTSGYEHALNEFGFAQGDLGAFNTEFNNNRVILRDLIAESNDSAKNSIKQNLTDSTKKINDSLKTIEKDMVNGQEQEQYTLLKQYLAQYWEVTNRIVGLVDQAKSDEAKTVMTQVATPLCTKTRSIVDKMVSQKTDFGNQVAKDLAQQKQISSYVMLGVLLISLLLAIAIAIIISRYISGSLQTLAFAAKKMANGDLSAEVNINAKNEIGDLAEAFHETITTLRAYITDIKVTLAEIAQGNLDVHLQEDFKGDFEELRISIRGIVVSFSDALTQMAQTAGQLSVSSLQVADGSQALAQGASEQASSVEELTATIEEISTHVKDNASHAVTASQNVAHVSTEIETSNRYMNNMMAAMKQIDDSSAQIGKIIKTIEDIAFQTNILALNAAVEAARAGSAGKGFAVVADEVRNLASKSALAAQDTTSLIENSLHQVKSGTKIAEETAKSLVHVVESAKAVSETVERISAASKRQSDAILQVSQGIEQISAVVQTNSATAEESAAASEELSGQAQNMDELVQRFKIRQNQKLNQIQSDASEPQESPVNGESAPEEGEIETDGKY